jgi:hypothetical protein
MTKSLIVLAVPFLFTACNMEGDYQISTVETIVSNVSFPDTINLGETVDIKLNYQIYNACGKYVGTEGSKSANRLLFRSFVKYTYEEGNACPSNVTTGEETIRFKPDAKGAYYLLFKKDSSPTYATDTLFVK